MQSIQMLLDVYQHEVPDRVPFMDISEHHKNFTFKQRQHEYNKYP